AYDRLNRLTFAGFGRTGPVGSPSYESSISYSDYDLGNRLTRLSDSQAGTIVRGYDGLDRLTCESKAASLPCTGTQTGAVTYSYDAAGRRQTMTLNGQPPVTYVHERGALTSDSWALCVWCRYHSRRL